MNQLYQGDQVQQIISLVIRLTNITMPREVATPTLKTASLMVNKIQPMNQLYQEGGPVSSSIINVRPLRTEILDDHHQQVRQKCLTVTHARVLSAIEWTGQIQSSHFTILSRQKTCHYAGKLMNHKLILLSLLQEPLVHVLVTATLKLTNTKNHLAPSQTQLQLSIGILNVDVLKISLQCHLVPSHPRISMVSL